MNKSKFLKKSLAAILSVLLVVAMIPLSAAAAPDAPAVYVNHRAAALSGTTYSIAKEIDPASVYLSTDSTVGDGVMRMYINDNVYKDLENNGENSTEQFDLSYWGTREEGTNVYTVKLKWLGDDADMDGQREVLGTYELKIDNTPGAANTETGINRVNLDDEAAAIDIYDPSEFGVDGAESTITITLPFSGDIPNKLQSTQSDTESIKIFEPTSSSAKVVYTYVAPTFGTGINVVDGTSLKIGTTTVTVGGQTQTYDVKVKWQPGFKSFEIEGQTGVEMGTTLTAITDGSVAPYVKVTMPFGTATDTVKPKFELGDSILKGTVDKTDGAPVDPRPLVSGMTFPKLENGTDGTNVKSNDGYNADGTVVTGGVATMKLVRRNYASADGAGLPVTLTVVDVAKNPKAELKTLKVKGITGTADAGLVSNVYDLTAGSTTVVELPKSFTGPKAQLELTGSTGAKVTIVEQSIDGDIDVNGKVTLGNDDTSADAITVTETDADKAEKTLRIRVDSEDGHTNAVYVVTFKKAAQEQALLTNLEFKGKNGAGETVTVAPGRKTSTADKNTFLWEFYVPYNWQLSTALEAVEVYATGSTGATVSSAATSPFDFVANRGGKIGATTSSTAGEINEKEKGAGGKVWDNNNLFQTGAFTKGTDEIKINVHNAKATPAAHNTYIIKFIPTGERTGHGITSASKFTSADKYSSVSENNTYTATTGTATDENGFTVNTLELKVPYSYKVATENVIRAVELNMHSGAKLIEDSTPNNVAAMDPTTYGTATENPITLATDGKQFSAYKDGKIDTAKAIKLYVVSEKAWVDEDGTEANIKSHLSDWVARKQATVYYLYATKAAPELGHDLLSIESTVDPNVLVSLDKSAKVITIDVPDTYDYRVGVQNNVSLFSLNFTTSKLAKVTFPTGQDADAQALIMKSDLGTTETTNRSLFYVSNQQLYYKTNGVEKKLTADADGKTTLKVTNEKGDVSSLYTVKIVRAPVQDGAEIKSVTAAGSTATISGTDIALTVPVGTDLTKQKLDIKYSRMATVKVNGVAYGPDKFYNLATPLTITVDSESDANHNTYKLTTKINESFIDVPAGIWFEEDVKKAVANGWIKGVGENRFDPYGKMTRGQFALIIARMDNTFSEKVEVTCPFSDVDGVEYKAAAKYVYDKGIMKGDGEMKFNPNDAITRQEAAIVLCNYMGLKPTSGASTYADKDSIADWAVEYVNAVTAAGIFKGDESNNFNATRQLMRCEGAAILVRSATK